MNGIEAIEKRRANHSLDPIEIADNIISKLGKAAQLSPSCMNNQPWEFLFIRDKEKLREMHQALSSGNYWAKDGSLIMAVIRKKKNDCMIRGRNYYLFDTGMVTAFIFLRATEMGLSTHPIAGFSEEQAKEILNIPNEMKLITFVIFGAKFSTPHPHLSEKHKYQEENRPSRKNISEFVYFDEYNNKFSLRGA